MLSDILTEIIAHRFGIPASTAKQTLKVMRGFLTGHFRYLSAVLAIDLREQAAQIRTRLTQQIAVRKVITESIHQLCKRNEKR